MLDTVEFETPYRLNPGYRQVLYYHLPLDYISLLVWLYLW